MPTSYEKYTISLPWARFDVSGGSVYTIPVGDLKITPKPYSEGSIGQTSIEDVNGTVYYRCEGFRHDLRINYSECPTPHHKTVQDLIMNLHNNDGEATFHPAHSQGTFDGTKAVDVVANFGTSVLPAEWSNRFRRRPATLQFKGKRILDSIKGWITE